MKSENSEEVTIVDEEELDKVTQESSNLKGSEVIITDQNKIQNVTQSTEFTKAIDQAKINVVEEATISDNKFVEDFKKKLKDATLKLAEVEEAKAKLEEQNIEYHSELLETQQRLNEHIQAENKWSNKEKRRQYHYNGVAPIMQFVGIQKPMNLLILYFLVIILMPFFLLGKLLRGTVGVVIAGAEDESRPKQVRGFLWTLLGILAVGVLALIVYLVIHSWLGLV